MFEQIKSWIYRLFGIKPRQTDSEISKAQESVTNYQDTEDINLTAVFAKALTTLAISDSSVSVTSKEDKEPSDRVKALNEVIQRQWRGSLKKDIEIGNGCGMVVSIPYIVEQNKQKKVYIDTVGIDRFLIMKAQGKEITEICVIADYFEKNNKKYYRFTYYQYEDGKYTIKNKGMINSSPCALSDVEEWANINEEITISNVERLPIGIYKCPATNRTTDMIDGVPITYGCDALIEKIKDTLSSIQKEFDAKKVKIFADDTLFDADKELSDIFMLTRASGKLGGGSMIDTFDPAIRTSAYYEKLANECALLEKQVGTSRGILTDLQTSSATATEIKRAMQATFAICDDIQTNLENYFEGLVYGINLLMDVYHVNASSEYDIKYDWSYSLIEDSDSTFSQLAEGYSLGVIGGAELRQFLVPGESLEDSQAYVDALKQKAIEANMQAMGMNQADQEEEPGTEDNEPKNGQEEPVKEEDE